MQYICCLEKWSLIFQHVGITAEILMIFTAQHMVLTAQHMRCTAQRMKFAAEEAPRA